MNEVKKVVVAGAGCELSVKVSGPDDGPVLLMVHGMRDHAESMRFLAGAFPGYRIITPDLRGHGDSDNPGAYGLLQFVADLAAVLDYFEVQQCVLVGHSLGGHICSRYASLFPARVNQLVLLDGQGPPGAADDHEGDNQEGRNDQWRRSISLQLAGEPRRTMTSMEEALDKLTANNPGLSIDRANQLVESGVVENEDGFAWKWDPRVDAIWTTFSHAESEASLPLIACPVLLVTGEYSLDYWSARREHLAGEDEYYRLELRRREKLFRSARSVVIPNAGHMLHYDQPEAVSKVMREFIITAG